MEFAAYKAEWLDILRTQEEILRPTDLTAEDALKLGLIMVRLSKEVYLKPVSIRIIVRGQVTFSYLMEGTDNYNNWWMDKKLNTARLTGVSSIRTLVEVAMGVRPMEAEFENEHNFALCGGCFPLRAPDGKQLGFVLCSGMKHECDHQLIADALSELMGREIPRIVE